MVNKEGLEKMMELKTNGELKELGSTKLPLFLPDKIECHFYFKQASPDMRDTLLRLQRSY